MSTPWKHKDYVSSRLAAKLLGVSWRDVRQMSRDGELRSQQVHGSAQVIVADLLRKRPELHGHPDLARDSEATTRKQKLTRMRNAPARK